MGYHALFFGLRIQNDTIAREDILNERYEAHQTVTLRIPLNLPYAYDQHNFQLTEGKFEFHGKIYQLVDQRVTQDTLYLTCLHDERNTTLEKDYSDFVKSFADQHSSQKATTLISFIKEYVGSNCDIKPVDLGWSNFIGYRTNENLLLSSYQVSIIHPPERT